MMFNFKTNNFDLIRLLAAFQVVIVHGHHHLSVGKGEALVQWFEVLPGVPIFFVISGFLISASLRRSASLQQYARNRFWRIYPGLWVCFLVSIISVLLFVGPALFLNASPMMLVAWVVSQLSFVQFFNPSFLRDYGVGVLNGSLWTIPVELQFYVALPLLYFVFGRLPHAFRSLGWGSFFVLSITAHQVYVLYEANNSLIIKLLGVSFLPYIYMFLLGVFLQHQPVFVRRFLVGSVHWWLLFYLGSSAFFWWLGLNVQGHNLNPVSALLLGLLTISFAYSYTGILSHIMRGFDMSYGIYIYHMLVFNVFVELNIVGSLWVLAAAILVISLLAAASWLVVESPSLRRKGRAKSVPSLVVTKPNAK